MADDEWFRRRTWTAGDQAAYFSRLSRSRSAQAKAQYLRIQAGHLEEVGEPALVHAALALLDMLVERWPEPIQLAQARAQQATCRLKLGDCGGAIEAYRLALQAETAFPNVRTNSAIELPWLIAREKLETEYAEALSLLASVDEPLYPELRFRLHGAWTLILAAQGRPAEAAVHARIAVAAASARNAGVRCHCDRGLLSETDGDHFDEIRRIGGAAEQGIEADER